jgi:predicted Rossmann fold nucleotide-binding protein DprA/Smf involved in DNA uptake
VLETYGLVLRARPAPDLSETASTVLERIREEARGADELVRATGFSAGGLAVALTELELAGVVREEDGVYRAAS